LIIKRLCRTRLFAQTLILYFCLFTIFGKIIIEIIFDQSQEILNLIFYDGTYRLQRRKTIISGRYAPAWRIRIIDFTLSLPEVRHLKPIAVVATSLSDESFKANCAESIL